MIFKGYIEPHCLRMNSCADLICKPYGQALFNLAKVCARYELIQGNVYKIHCGRRIACLLVGIVLLIPMINSIFLYILQLIHVRIHRRIEKEKQERIDRTTFNLKVLKGFVRVAVRSRKLLRTARAHIEATRKAADSQPLREFSTLKRVGAGVGTVVGKVAEKSFHMMQKSRAVLSRITGGARARAAEAAVGNAAIAVEALRGGRVRIALYSIGMTLGHVFNAAVNLVVPREVRETIRLQR